MSDGGESKGRRRHEKHGVSKSQQGQCGWKRVGKERKVNNERGELGKNWKGSSQRGRRSRKGAAGASEIGVWGTMEAKRKKRAS